MRSEPAIGIRCNVQRWGFRRMHDGDESAGVVGNPVATNARQRFRAFTLVELLVVIAVVGILIAMLIPAVQAARESSRTAACRNNLRHLGLALLQHHDHLNTFPSGGESIDPPPGYHGTPYGFSWYPRILPFLEEQSLYDRLFFGIHCGWRRETYSVINGVVIPAFFCPSSPLPRLAIDQFPGYSRIAGASYVGIAGAAPGLIPNFTEARVNSNGWGIAGGGGVLIPNGANRADGRRMRVARIGDGTTKTLMLGEQSGHLITADGVQRNFASPNRHGWFIGVPLGGTPGIPPGWVGDRIWNITTIRYGVNPGGLTESTPAGVCGSNPSMGCLNIPLLSAHSGGALSCRADGSVQWLENTTELDVLARLATRDDGTVGKAQP
jgi:prepilin-type N-terminal cleavage/methylation domain-containing protein